MRHESVQDESDARKFTTPFRTRGRRRGLRLGSRRAETTTFTTGFTSRDAERSLATNWRARRPQITALEAITQEDPVVLIKIVWSNQDQVRIALRGAPQVRGDGTCHCFAV